MRITKWVETSQEVDVEVSIDDVISSLASMPEDQQLHWMLSAITTAHGVLKRIPDDAIAAMKEGQRKVIRDALLEQAHRYEISGER